MKTRKLFIALGAVLISGMIATSVFATNDVKVTPVQAKQDITYVVNISHNEHMAGFNGKFVVMLTNERGQPVAQPQLFRIGIWTYTFKELGDVQGTRAAKMMADPNTIFPGAYIFYPDVQQGPFIGGRTYLFNLTPVPGPKTSVNEVGR